jgi:hypothetical protein
VDSCFSRWVRVDQKEHVVVWTHMQTPHSWREANFALGAKQGDLRT